MSRKKPQTPQGRHEWLLRIAIAAVFAVVGAIVKDAVEYWRLSQTQKQAVADATLGALKELSALLDESYRIFAMQEAQAQRLLSLLRQRHGRKMPDNPDTDAVFYSLHDRFTPEEATLQKLIRSTTMNSQRRVNLALSAWLQRTPALMYDDQPTPARAALSAQLSMLQLTLNRWHDRYDAWIPDDPKRSLVYLADEPVHGVGFPPGLEQAVKDAIASWK